MRKFPTTQHEHVCACVCVRGVVPKHGAPLWLKRWRSVQCALCPRWTWKHARRYTEGLSHQLATWTSESTWRWYSISSAGFRHIAPSSPAACQTTGTPESHNPVKEGQAEYWSVFRFKEDKLSRSWGWWQRFFIFLQFFASVRWFFIMFAWERNQLHLIMS